MMRDYIYGQNVREYGFKFGVNKMVSNNQFKQIEMIRRHLSSPLNAGEETEARELQLYIENDGDLYRQMIEPAEKSMVRKFKMGIQNDELGILQFLHIADAGAKKYQREFTDSETSRIFSLKVRVYVARELYKTFAEEYRLGNYD